MDVLEFVARVLCRLDLPDAAVYPALALARNARQSGDKQEILRTEKVLTECFLDCVRRGLQLKKEEDPWQALDKHPLLAEKPARPQSSPEIPTVEQQQHWQSLILEIVEDNSSPKMQSSTELRQLIWEILWGDEPEQAPLPSLKSAQSMDEVDLIHRVLCRLDLPDAAVYSSLPDCAMFGRLKTAIRLPSPFVSCCVPSSKRSAWASVLPRNRSPGSICGNERNSKTTPISRQC